MIDRDLIRKCIRGDRVAQKQFYYGHIDSLKRVSLRYAQNSTEAKDVLQNAFVRIFTHLASADLSKDSLIPWMRRIVINEAFRIKKVHHEPIDEGRALGIEYSVSLEAALNSLEIQDLYHVIDQLPYKYRVVFQLKEVEGYSHEEIAEVMKIEVSSSRSLLTRSKKKLKNLIDEYYTIKESKL